MIYSIKRFQLTYDLLIIMKLQVIHVSAIRINSVDTIFFKCFLLNNHIMFIYLTYTCTYILFVYSKHKNNGPLLRVLLICSMKSSLAVQDFYWKLCLIFLSFAIFTWRTGSLNAANFKYLVFSIGFILAKCCQFLFSHYFLDCRLLSA